MAEIHPSENQPNGIGGPVVVGSSETVGSKRQRRPSVRLGEIGGEQPYDSHGRKVVASSSKPWKHQGGNHSLNPSAAAKSTKVRPLTNLSSEFNQETLDGEEKNGNINNSNLDSVAIGSWRVKDTKKRGSTATKRVRSNWVSKGDEGDGGGGDGTAGNGSNKNLQLGDKFSGGEDADGFYLEKYDSPLNEQSPIHSLGVDGNEREGFYHGNNGRRSARARVSENRDHHDAMELSGPSDTEMRRCGEEDGVRIWLNSLGLGRYAPVFEIHEVDDEVLPLLTLEDLKDMGINAVGTRRKMFCAIQKLSKGFS